MREIHVQLRLNTNVAVYVPRPTIQPSLVEVTTMNVWVSWDLPAKYQTTCLPGSFVAEDVKTTFKCAS